MNDTTKSGDSDVRVYALTAQVWRWEVRTLGNRLLQIGTSPSRDVAMLDGVALGSGNGGKTVTHRINSCFSYYFMPHAYSEAFGITEPVQYSDVFDKDGEWTKRAWKIIDMADGEILVDRSPNVLTTKTEGSL